MQYSLSIWFLAMLGDSTAYAIEGVQSAARATVGTLPWVLKAGYASFVVAGALFILYIAAALVLRRIPSRKQPEPLEDLGAKYTRCPHCAIIIAADATACDYCGAPLNQPPSTDSPSPSTTGDSDAPGGELPTQRMTPSARRRRTITAPAEPFTPVLKLPLPRLNLIAGLLILYLFVILVFAVGKKIYRIASEDFQRAQPEREATLPAGGIYNQRHASYDPRAKLIEATPTSAPPPRAKEHSPVEDPLRSEASHAAPTRQASGRDSTN